jgi:hypothetical protein
MDKPKTSFSDTLKTWETDPGTPGIPGKPKPIVGTTIQAPAKPSAPASKAPPMPEPPPREFADHMDRAQQAVKDWVRKELHLAMHGVSHEDRIAENP